MKITGTLSAIASATLTLVAWTRVRCPRCNRLMLSWPGVVPLEPRETDEPSGRGPVMACQRCGSVIEVVPHG